LTSAGGLWEQVAQQRTLKYTSKFNPLPGKKVGNCKQHTTQLQSKVITIEKGRHLRKGLKGVLFSPRATNFRMNGKWTLLISTLYRFMQPFIHLFTHFIQLF